MAFIAEISGAVVWPLARFVRLSIETASTRVRTSPQVPEPFPAFRLSTLILLTLDRLLRLFRSSAIIGLSYLIAGNCALKSRDTP